MKHLTTAALLCALSLAACDREPPPKKQSRAHASPTPATFHWQVKALPDADGDTNDNGIPDKVEHRLADMKLGVGAYRAAQVLGLYFDDTPYSDEGAILRYRALNVARNCLFEDEGDQHASVFDRIVGQFVSEDRPFEQFQRWTEITSSLLFPEEVITLPADYCKPTTRSRDAAWIDAVAAVTMPAIEPLDVEAINANAARVREQALDEPAATPEPAEPPPEAILIESEPDMRPVNWDDVPEPEPLIEDETSERGKTSP